LPVIIFEAVDISGFELMFSFSLSLKGCKNKALEEKFLKAKKYFAI